MILDEIQEAYFKDGYYSAISVELKISVETYRQMLLQDSRLTMLCRPEDGQLHLMFGRPVFIKHDLDVPWAWSTN
ncbi:hypothetical protein J520_0276 [Acinetobacter sp. 869535]|uniref:hypothetical protein n=1 Tax=Acinetobacter sp. 869535 TaxID=1310621 RepID=UPI0004450DBB|nr:hypothetical protein [Acinetobacter sp. 869535]EXC34384.1 hypothetical protein J520_0276 [Acinetobacter sp. 869535]